MESALVKQYINAMRAAVEKERQRSTAVERAAALDQELYLIVLQYKALLIRWENAQKRGMLSASLARKVDRVVTQRQQIIEEKIALGDLYGVLVHEEREAQELVRRLQQELQESLNRQRDEPRPSQGIT